MTLPEEQKSVIWKILGESPDTWSSAITLQANEIPKENRLEFGEILLDQVSCYYYIVKRASKILRRGPNLSPQENFKAFSLFHASYLATFFIDHPTLCERLCAKIKNQQNNSGWRNEVNRLREIESCKLKIKDQVQAEIDRSPPGNDADIFSLEEIIFVMGYVALVPWACRNMMVLWPEYKLFEEYTFEACRLEAEKTEGGREDQDTAANHTEAVPPGGMKFYEAHVFIRRMPINVHALAIDHLARLSGHQQKRSRFNFGDDEVNEVNDDDMSYEKKPQDTKARRSNKI